MLAFVLACTFNASAQLDEWGYWENGVTEHWWLSSDDFASEDAVNAVARWKSIGEANALDAGGSWAGDYFRGSDTGGTYMRWSPHAGFVIAHVDKCAARVKGIIYGRVEATPTLVQLFPEFYKVPPRKHVGDGEQQQQEVAQPPAVIRYVPVEWRGEHLLVAENEMGEFGDFIAGLGEYNGRSDFMPDAYAEFFSRTEAQDEAGEGEEVVYPPPVVPPGYERFLKKPIEATVTAVGRRSIKRDYTLELPYLMTTHVRASITRVTISAGTAQGVKDRMVFRVVEPEEDDTAVVVHVRENESDAIIIRDVNERGREVYYDEESREMKRSKVVAGWRLTTSPF